MYMVSGAEIQFSPEANLKAMFSLQTGHFRQKGKGTGSPQISLSASETPAYDGKLNVVTCREVEM